PACPGGPVLVGGAGGRGVVAAASYEAREFGCRSAMPTAVARRLCPQAEVVRPRGARYRELSDVVFGILAEFSPLVQPLSIDEAFVDLTGTGALLGEPIAVGERIRARIRERTGLTASVGIAPNKFLAKLASDLDKPDGLVVIEPARIHDVLDPLPVSRLWGVGASAEDHLHRLGLRTIADVRATPEAVLADRLGDFGRHIARLSRGEDDRPVVPDREAKSISHERTFGENLGDPGEVLSVIDGQAEDVARRVRAAGVAARRVTVKIRYGDFETITRSDTLPEPTDGTGELREAARTLFRRWAERQFRPVRLIGVAAADLGPAGAQLGLFDQERRERDHRVDETADEIARKFGRGAIRRASTLGNPGRGSSRDK
ncbi:MAG: DNA polymerase IV, partial [Planctomycetota bacterium]